MTYCKLCGGGPCIVKEKISSLETIHDYDRCTACGGKECQCPQVLQFRIEELKNKLTKVRGHLSWMKTFMDYNNPVDVDAGAYTEKEQIRQIYKRVMEIRESLRYEEYEQ